MSWFEIKDGEEIFNKWKKVFFEMEQVMSCIVRTNSIVQNDMIVPSSNIEESREILFKNLIRLDAEYSAAVEEVKQLWSDSVKLMRKVDEPTEENQEDQGSAGERGELL